MAVLILAVLCLALPALALASARDKAPAPRPALPLDAPYRRGETATTREIGNARVMARVTLAELSRRDNRPRLVHEPIPRLH